jgi:hypothetical protein
MFLSPFEMALLPIRYYVIMSAMTTLNDLQILADRLTKVSPPPQDLTNKKDQFIVGSGRWKVEMVGAGFYAVRIEYDTTQNKKVVMKADQELRGFADTLSQSLRFAEFIANPSRHHWLPV